MTKETVGKKKIYLEYDDEKYEINYYETGNIDAKLENCLIVKRKSDNKVMAILNGDVRFIVEFIIPKNHSIVPHFVVGRCENNQNMLYNFTDNNYNEFYLRSKNEVPSLDIDTIRLGYHSFIIGDENEKRIYNLDKKSDNFAKIYTDYRLNELVPKNTILVLDHHYARNEELGYDTLTYGINPDTLEITTPIWSDIQQRFIPIYSEEKVEEIKNKDRIMDTLDASRITLFKEVELTLFALDKYKDKSNSVYDDEGKVINRKFVKELVKNHKVN